MSPAYEVEVLAPASLRYASYLLAGLFELEARGVVRLALSPWPRRGAPSGFGQHTTACRVRARGRDVLLAFDFRDAADSLPPDWRDYHCVFKRSFEPDRLAPFVPEAERARVHPAGLVYEVRSRHEHGRGQLQLGAWLQGLRRLPGPVRRPTAGLWGTVMDRLVRPLRHEVQLPGRAYQRYPVIEDYEAQPAETEPFVLFQTRVFGPEPRDTPEFLASKEAVNQQRIRLALRLRQALGRHFVGGIVPDAVGRRLAPAEALTSERTDRPSYLGLVRRARAVVYTAGLVGSAAFKLAELLAAGKAVVAEPPRTVLPTPLTFGRELIGGDDDEALVSACRTLLDDPDQALRLGEAASAYYQAHVHPAASVERMLRLAVERSGARPAAGCFTPLSGRPFRLPSASP